MQRCLVPREVGMHDRPSRGIRRRGHVMQARRVGGRPGILRASGASQPPCRLAETGLPEQPYGRVDRKSPLPPFDALRPAHPDIAYLAGLS